MRFIKLFTVIGFSILTVSAKAQEKGLTKLRIGWQVPWATQGQIVQIWKHTDILKKHGIEAEFVGRTYGPQLNEAALAGELDVILTADQPAAALFSKDKGWVGVSRLMYNRTLTYVPPHSKIKDVKGLKGKVIGLPVGAAAERVTVAALQKNGLDPKKDVKIINLGILEQGPLISQGAKELTWGNFDAMSGFDPAPAIFESKGWIRVLDIGKVVSMVLMNKTFLEANPGVAKKLNTALIDAYDYYRQNQSTANTWFMKEAQLKEANQKACELAASIEPNLKAKSRSDIRVSFNEDDFSVIQSAADFLQPQLKKRVDMKTFVNNKYTESLTK